VSTSPAVFFGPNSGNQIRKMPDGTKLLIEGDPELVDHIAIVPAGVWDKGGEPSGVINSLLEERADAAFSEADHPRDEDGKFTEGSGSRPTSSVKLTPTQKTYISSYTGDDFYETNKELREGKSGRSNVKHIDEAIDKSTLQPGTKLYRGMSREAAKKMIGGAQVNKGDIISDKAFMSAGKEKDFISSFYGLGGVVLEITTSEGQKGLDVSEFTRNKQEGEVLLPRNTKMRVSSIVAPKKVGDPVLIKVETVTETEVSDASDPAKESKDSTMPETEEDRARKDAEMHAKLDAIVGKLDAAHGRLDAMEMADKARKDAEEKERMDHARFDSARRDRFSHRKDGESRKDWEARHDADETAMCDAMRKDGCDEAKAREDAKRARHDAEEAERKDGGESFEKWAKEEGEEPEHKEDKARKDAAEKAEREAADRARHDSVVTAEVADLRRQLAAMSAHFVPVTIEERNALAAAQARADGIAGLFGTRALPPIPGEKPIEYRRRLAGEFKQHSTRFKDKSLASLDGDMLGIMEDQIYADAASAARSPDRAGAVGVLIPIREPDEAGRIITRYTGDPLAWMQHFMTGGQSGRIIRNPGATA